MQIHLQSIGKVNAKPAGELLIGDTTLWNFGFKSKVVSILKETEKSVTILLEDGERRFLKTRLVGCA